MLGLHCRACVHPGRLTRAWPAAAPARVSLAGSQADSWCSSDALCADTALLADVKCSWSAAPILPAPSSCYVGSWSSTANVGGAVQPGRGA